MRQPQTPPEVSVVIPTYNRPGLLRRAVTSALGQDDVRLEVIVVDDGSSPRVTADALPSGVTIVRNSEDGGVATARNLGAQLAQTPWLAFLDDDDWWAPDHLCRLLSVANASAAGFAYAGRWNVNLATGEVTLSPALPAQELATRLLHENAVGTPSGVIVQRSLYLDVGGSDPSLAAMADWDLWIRLAGVARGVASPVATVAYAVHDQNMSSDIPQLLTEFTRLTERHAQACQRNRVRFGDVGFPRWIARLYRDEGRRVRAASWYLRSARAPTCRLDAVRAVGVLLGERVMRVGQRPAIGQGVPPPDWLNDPTADPLPVHAGAEH